MKKLIFQAIISLAAIISAANAQTNKSDVLRSLILRESQDSSKCMLLTQLCWHYIYSRPDTAMAIAQSGLKLAKEIRFKKGEAFFMSDIGIILCERGDNVHALELLLQALKESEPINNPALSVNINIGIAHVYISEGDLSRAMEYELQAMKIADSGQDDFLLMRTANSVGSVYNALGKQDSAKWFDEKAYDLSLKLKDDDFTGVILTNLATVHDVMGQQTIALDYERLAVPLLRATEDNSVLCYTYLSMARLFKKISVLDSAMYYAALSMAVAKRNGYVGSVLDAADFLAAHYKEVRATDSAYAYLQMVIAAKDTLYGQEKTKELQNLSFNETLRQMDIAVEKKTAAQERRNNLEILVITAILIALIAIFFALSRSFIVHERWIKFLGILGLLVTFEYFYILIDPLVIRITNESPLWMLLVLIAIALALEPLHNRVEHWITHKVIAKNKQLRLAAAKKTVARLESEAGGQESEHSTST